ncbi:MAG: hypothetical protein ACYS22_05105 [Planctomycetota bacterium]|jgi:hypothetical protein
MALYLSPEPESSTIMLVEGRIGWFEATADAHGLVVHVAAYTKARLDGREGASDKDITVRLHSGGGDLIVTDVTLHAQTASNHPDLIAWVLQALGDADEGGIVDQLSFLGTLERRLHHGLPHGLTRD